MSQNRIIAAFTGDIIKSRRAPRNALEQAFDILHQSATDFGHQQDMDLRFTRHRGDGWQVALNDPACTFDAILYFIARLRAGQTALDTRISVAIAPADTLGTTDLADANGSAFFIAGDGLETMPRTRRITIAGHGIGVAQIALVDLAECISTGWTASQAEAVAMALLEPAKTHEDIASELGITRQAVQSRLASAGFGYFDTARAAMRRIDTTMNSTETRQ